MEGSANYYYLLFVGSFFQPSKIRLPPMREKTREVPENTETEKTDQVSEDKTEKQTNDKNNTTPEDTTQTTDLAVKKPTLDDELLESIHFLNSYIVEALPPETGLISQIMFYFNNSLHYSPVYQKAKLIKKRLVQLEKMNILSTLLLHVIRGVASSKSNFTKQHWEVLLYRIIMCSAFLRQFSEDTAKAALPLQSGLIKSHFASVSLLLLSSYSRIFSSLYNIDYYLCVIYNYIRKNIEIESLEITTIEEVIKYHSLVRFKLGALPNTWESVDFYKMVKDNKLTTITPIALQKTAKYSRNQLAQIRQDQIRKAAIAQKELTRRVQKEKKGNASRYFLANNELEESEYEDEDEEYDEEDEFDEREKKIEKNNKKTVNYAYVPSRGNQIGTRRGGNRDKKDNNKIKKQTNKKDNKQNNKQEDNNDNKQEEKPQEIEKKKKKGVKGRKKEKERKRKREEGEGEVEETFPLFVIDKKKSNIEV